MVTFAPIGKHAIVIGAGVGGLAAAAAVGSHFEHVTIVERNVLLVDTSPLPRTPQDKHLHSLFIGDSVSPLALLVILSSCVAYDRE